MTHITKLFQSFGKLKAKTVQINIADLRTGDSPENKMVEVQRLQLSEHSIRRKTGKLKSIEDLQHLE